MLGSLKVFFDSFRATGGSDTAKAEGAEPAVAALLVRAASLDGDFAPEEREAIRTLLETHFEKSPAAATQMIEDAEKELEGSVDSYAFTRVIRDEFDHDRRVDLMEMLWQVAYADGELHDFEANLMRRIAGLIYVTDQESGAARKRVMQKLGLAE